MRRRYRLSPSRFIYLANLNCLQHDKINFNRHFYISTLRFLLIFFDSIDSSKDILWIYSNNLHEDREKYYREISINLLLRYNMEKYGIIGNVVDHCWPDYRYFLSLRNKNVRYVSRSNIHFTFTARFIFQTIWNFDSKHSIDTLVNWKIFLKHIEIFKNLKYPWSDTNLFQKWMLS